MLVLDLRPLPFLWGVVSTDERPDFEPDSDTVAPAVAAAALASALAFARANRADFASTMKAAHRLQSPRVQDSHVSHRDEAVQPLQNAQVAWSIHGLVISSGARIWPQPTHFRTAILFSQSELIEQVGQVDTMTEVSGHWPKIASTQ